MQKVLKLRIRRVAPALSCSPLRESELALQHQNLQLPLARRRGQTFRALYTPTSGGRKVGGGDEGDSERSLLLFWLLQITGINFNHLLN